MYNQFFGLSENPFSIAPNPRFLFMSDRHKEALAHLLYGVSEGGGFVMLTGEVGTGKTTICRCLLEQLPEHCELAFILNPKLTSIELLAAICDDLQIDYEKNAPTVKMLMDALSRHLIQKHKENKRVVLMIDEAQNLAADVLEQIRLLTNLETNTEKLLQIVLIGQPELKALLNRRVLRQLAQRVTARYHLEPLTEEETHEYIEHRLAVAGQTSNVFNAKSIRLLHHITGGIPRLINSICDRAMLGAYVQNKKSIDPNVIKKAAKEVLGDQAKQLISTASRSKKVLIEDEGESKVTLPIIISLSSLGTLVLVIMILFLTGVIRFSSPISTPDSQPVAATLLETEPSNMSGTIATGTQNEVGEAVAKEVAQEQPEQQVQETHVIAVEEANEDDSPQESQPVISESAQLKDWWGEQNWDRESHVSTQQLFKLWGVQYEPLKDGPPCAYARKKGLKCDSGFGNWDLLIRLNRPAVLKFISEERGPFFGVIEKLSENEKSVQVSLILGDNRIMVPFLSVKDLWSGNYTLLWKTPPGYQRAVGRSARGEIVTWMSEKLASIAGDSTYDAISRYDRALKKRIMAFQKANALLPDGVAGTHTLIMMNSYLYSDIPKLYMGDRPQLIVVGGEN